jgi:beta-glucosidase-like glycosyl hydrolase
MNKANKQITLDIELIIKLNEAGLNVSEFCNEKLWEYVINLEGVKKSKETTENLDTKITELTREKEDLKKQEALKKSMSEAGITKEKLKFLKAMNTNITCAKNNKLGWLRKFNEEIQWEELIELKKKWA